MVDSCLLSLLFIILFVYYPFCLLSLVLMFHNSIKVFFNVCLWIEINP